MPEFDPDFSIIDGDFRVGDFHVRPLLKVIRPLKAGASNKAEERRLPDKAMAVLLLLAENCRQVCEREFLLDEVWGPERESYDRVLDNAIREIRRAFGDDARNPEYIQAIAKTGYRLIAEVEGMEGFGARTSVDAGDQKPSDEHFAAGSAPSGQERENRRSAPRPPSTDQGGEKLGSPTGVQPPLQSPQPPDSPAVASSPEISGTEAPRNGRGTPRRPVTWIVVALLVFIPILWAAPALWSPRVLSVSVEIVEEGAESPALSEQQVEEAFREAIETDHPCGESSRIRLASPWLSRGPAARIVVDPGVEDPSQLLAIVSGPETTLRVAMRLGLNPPEITLGELAHQTIERLDGWICSLEEFPDRDRSCHCLASARTWNFFEEFDPYLENLETAVRLAPSNLGALEGLVQIYLLAGYRDQAEELISEGLSRVPDPSSTPALALLRRLAQLHRDYEEEGRLIEALTQRSPDDPRWLLSRAVFLRYHDQNCPASLELFEDLRRRFPERSDILAEKAVTLHQCGETEWAIDALSSRIWSSASSELDLRIRLASFLNAAGYYERAEETTKQAFAVNPESSLIRFQMGMIARHTGALDTAALWFQRAAEVAQVPHELEMSRVWRARVLLEAGHPKQALEVLSSVDRSVIGLDFLPAINEGLAHLALEDVEAARVVLDQLHMLRDLRGSQAQRSLMQRLEAAILAFEGRYDEALQAIDRAAQMPAYEHHVVQLEKAEIARDAGKPEVAQRALERLFEINPSYGLGHCFAGKLYEELGRRDEALEAYRRGLANLPRPEQSPGGTACLARLKELDS